MGVSLLANPSSHPCAHSLGELPQLGLDAAVAHAHARERRADVPSGPWRGKGRGMGRDPPAAAVPDLSRQGARPHHQARPEGRPPQPASLLSILQPCGVGLMDLPCLPAPWPSWWDILATPTSSSCRCSKNHLTLMRNPL